MCQRAGGTVAATMGVVNDPAKDLGSCPFPLPGNEHIKGVITFTVIFDYFTTADILEKAGVEVELLLIPGAYYNQEQQSIDGCCCRLIN
jgi:hypothetical protein